MRTAKMKLGEIFPEMWRVVPERQHGVARVEHFTLDRFESQMTAFYGRRNFVPPGRYARLIVRGELFMSDTPYERRTNRRFVDHADGRVLIAGLGLGMVLTAVLQKPTVSDVVVVEKEPDVIALVEPEIRRWLGRRMRARLRVLCADIHEARRVVDPYGPFDALWFDIWADVSTDVLAEMTALMRKYRWLCRDRESFMDCWDREWLRYQKRRTG